MSDAIGSQNTCETFWTELYDWRIQSKKSSFSNESASQNSQSKKLSRKSPFFACVRKPDLGFSRKRPLSTGKCDCIRNGLSAKNGKAHSWSKYKMAKNRQKKTTFQRLDVMER